MTVYYIMVSTWIDGKLGSKEDCTKTLRIETSPRKADKAAMNYEKELNGGLTWQEAVMAFPRRNIIFSTCAIPFSQAREYISFREWADCPEYKATI